MFPRDGLNQSGRGDGKIDTFSEVYVRLIAQNQFRGCRLDPIKSDGSEHLGAELWRAFRGTFNLADAAHQRLRFVWARPYGQSRILEPLHKSGSQQQI